jgi:hypothetical protein
MTSQKSDEKADLLSDLQKLYGDSVRVLGIETAHIAGDLHKAGGDRDITALFKFRVLGLDIGHVERQVWTADLIVMKVENTAAAGFVLQELKHEWARLQVHATQSSTRIIGKGIEFLALSIERLACRHSGHVTIKAKRTFEIFDRESNMKQFRHFFRPSSVSRPFQFRAGLWPRLERARLVPVSVV